MASDEQDLGPDGDLNDVVNRFWDPRQEWCRWIAEIAGTFFLVLVAAGGPMVAVAIPGSVGRVAAVVAPGLMVTAIIMSMGKVSGAHLNPVVSLAFAIRRDFPWQRVPGYIVAQFIGAILAALVLTGITTVSAAEGATYPATGDVASFWTEVVLTFGLLTVILGTASGAQNIGVVGALGVGGYIALAGLWASPISGASMNPARSLGPMMIGGDMQSWWVYVAGPFVGALVAVGLAYSLRGGGGGVDGSEAAQGALGTSIEHPRRR